MNDAERAAAIASLTALASQHRRHATALRRPDGFTAWTRGAAVNPVVDGDRLGAHFAGVADRAAARIDAELTRLLAAPRDLPTVNKET